ncbi:hypothetical protein ACFP1Z_26465 [Streptomyces gamaensis]|uniref:DUF4232 domain-containing protein n=1 Tax=Streptomyces gamaensis TaxID=1763542 RepID=A0ABW0Z7E1_9ACTN
MGSLRNPIGPLPSSIYWRRRAVALGVLGLLVLLVVWLVGVGGDGGSGGSQSKGSNGSQQGPSDTTITPGPTPSGPHYSQRPGGRGDSGGATGGGTGDHPTGGGTGGGGTGGGAAGSGGSSTGGVGAPAGVLGTGDSRSVAATSSLPDCTAAATRLQVRSVKNSYGPDEKPKFEIVVLNTGGSACKVDFATGAAVLSITDPGGEEHIWSSGDCAKGAAPFLVEVPGSGQTKRTVEWDRKRSAPNCATPSGDTLAAPGTYRVEIKVAGVTERLEFALDKS